MAEEDPEQRIRELERSLAERAVELGSSSAEAGTPVPTYIPPQDPYPPPPNYSTYPAPPPGAYGPAYPPPPVYAGTPVTFGTPFPRTATRAFRLSRVFFAIPLVGIVIAGIAFFSIFSAARDVTGQFSSITSAKPSVGVPAPTRAATPATAAEGATVSVSGVSKRQALTCAGGSVNISGVSNVVEITGHCATVIVSGVENVVTVESADSISASGFTNRVSFASGDPETSATGDNVIERAQ